MPAPITSMNTLNNIASLLTHLFDAWNEADIRYLILRNYEELPEYTGNDVDILIDPRQLVVTQVILEKVASEEGWRIHNIGEFACRAIFLFNTETLEQLHLDLMCGIKWHTLQFLDNERMLDCSRPLKNFHIPSIADEAAVNLMTRLLYGGYVKEKYKEGIRQAALGNREKFVETLHPWVGTQLAENVVEKTIEGQWGAIESQVQAVRKQVVLANLRDPVCLLSSLVSDVFRFVRRWTRAPGISVVFLGPDGCGKTSVADGLKGRLEKTFCPERGIHSHWKPIRSKGASFAPTEDPHGKPSRNSLMSLAYFIYHYLPFIWGWWIHVKPVLFKNGLVIIDRYYYDFFVDRQRYRLNLPQWIVRLGFVFVKKPDLVFCLDADPEILQARKKEVSFDECSRQRNAYRKLAEELSDGHVIDASQPLEKVVQDVQRIVLEYMVERTVRRLDEL